MFHKLVGLTLFGEDGYQTYRKKIAPILKSYSGQFHFDFEVNAVYKSEAEQTINRVFILSFPDESTSAKFSGDRRYQELLAEYCSPTDNYVH